MGKPANNKTKGASDRRKRSAKRAPSSGTRKLSPAGAKIVGAFEEAIALMRTGEPLERHFTIRTYKAEFTPRDYGPDDVRRVRDLLGMSQVLFARFLGVNANTVRSWEQGTRPPSADRAAIHGRDRGRSRALAATNRPECDRGGEQAGNSLKERVNPLPSQQAGPRGTIASLRSPPCDPDVLRGVNHCARRDPRGSRPRSLRATSHQTPDTRPCESASPTTPPWPARHCAGW